MEPLIFSGELPSKVDQDMNAQKHVSEQQVCDVSYELPEPSSDPVSERHLPEKRRNIQSGIPSVLDSQECLMNNGNNQFFFI